MNKWRQSFKPIARRNLVPRAFSQAREKSLGTRLSLGVVNGKPKPLTFDIPVKTAKHIEVIRLQVQNTLQFQKALLSSGRSHRVVLLCETLNIQRAYLYPGVLEQFSLNCPKWLAFASICDWLAFIKLAPKPKPIMTRSHRFSRKIVGYKYLL